jgi:hypothetical protein
MKRTGGAETNDGHERLTSSENISSNSIQFCALVVGANPSLIWMVPVLGVPTQVDMTSREKA